VVTPEHRAAANRVRELMAKYEEVELLVKIGEYKKGSDALADQALSKIDAIRAFLRQAGQKKLSFADTVQAMQRLV